MKKINILYLFWVILASCSSGGDGDGGDTTPNPVNTAPTIPSLKSPTNNLICINNVVSFSWNGSTDAENDAVTYQLEIATDANFTTDLITNKTTLLSKDVTLSKGKYYYWRIKAIDAKNEASAYTSVFKFYTEMDGVLNHLPYSPALTSPAMYSTINTSTVTLSWTGQDSDNDTLSYDVYFGTTNTPTQKVASDISTTTYEATSLSASTTYYWYVVVKDGKGGTTIGQVWNFTKQ